jgi:tripartite-type tricarboxylate transporter receptor subunit TctC
MPRIASRRRVAETMRRVANAASARRASRLLRLAAASVALAGLHIPAGAADWPARPVRFVVGPGPDVLARLVGQQLTERWGQQVVVDQRPGAGGIIAAETVAKATADGHTLLLTTGSYTINHTLRKKLPYDLTRDLAPVALLATIQFLLATPPGLPVKDVEDLLRLARAQPGKLNCASSGTGTTAHLGCEMLNQLGRVSLVHVPYKGLAAAVTDLLGGRMESGFVVMQAGLPYVRSGKLRALAVSGAKRSAAIAELPTVAEAGVPGFAFESWNGVHVPAATPRAIVARLNRDLVATIEIPQVRKRMLELGLEPAGGTPDAFAAFVRDDIARWARLIAQAGVRVD